MTTHSPDKLRAVLEWFQREHGNDAVPKSVEDALYAMGGLDDSACVALAAALLGAQRDEVSASKESGRIAGLYLRAKQECDRLAAQVAELEADRESLRSLRTELWEGVRAHGLKAPTEHQEPGESARLIHAYCGGIAALRNEVAELRGENERLERFVNDLQAGLYINCVYCGHRYGPDDEHAATLVEDGATPSMQEALKAHIEQCPKHPMAAITAELARLREENDEARAELDEARRSLGRRDRDSEELRCELRHYRTQHDPRVCVDTMEHAEKLAAELARLRPVVELVGKYRENLRSIGFREIAAAVEAADADSKREEESDADKG